MRIAIIGYGKMGKMIEGIALERGHEITCRIDKENLEDFNSDAFRGSDVAIEFTTPSTAAENVLRCFAADVPVVCGTTAWTGMKSSTDSSKTMLEEMRQMCEEGHGTMLWASNFSIGVNVFMAVNRYLTRLMNRFPQYTPSMTEIHHIHKLDHPSGTAITLAEGMIKESERLYDWEEGETVNNTLGIKALREGEVPGIHTIAWDSDVDTITISHSAKSRKGFALGAVLAAEYLAGKKGWHSIEEVLGI